MVSTQQRTWWLGVVAAFGVFLVAAPFAQAGDASSPEQQVAQFRAQLEGLETEANDADAAEEFRQASTWLEEADQLASRGARSGVEQRLRRVDHAIDLLQALIRTHEITHSIESQHQAYENSKKQVETIKEDIERMEKQKQERMQELERIRSQE